METRQVLRSALCSASRKVLAMDGCNDGQSKCVCGVEQDSEHRTRFPREPHCAVLATFRPEQVEKESSAKNKSYKDACKNVVRSNANIVAVIDVDIVPVASRLASDKVSSIEIV